MTMLSPTAETRQRQKGERMSQNQKVLMHLEKWGSITTLDAFNCYGITRLSARIDNLKHAGHKISKTMEYGENRYGEITRYARYRLEA